MNIIRFQKQSFRTMVFRGAPKDQKEFNHMLAEYSMGLSGEVSEAFAIHISTPITDVDMEKLEKELGDISHYAVGLAAIADVDLPKKFPLPEPEDIPMCETFEKLIIEAGVILEHAKKVVYHDHEFDSKQIDVIEILHLTSTIAVGYGLDYSDVLIANIEKLKKRYPHKFSTKDSIARVDILE